MRHVDRFIKAYKCPWCQAPIEIAVEVGLTNRRAAAAKRATVAAVRHTPSITHLCVDPTVRAAEAVGEPGSDDSSLPRRLR